ncbi:MAG: L,D-transpeptidase [Coleofasciculaceae cyanobacterium RL_1_1]|nr:L,D-transpeptidase [Coleofasciculaceae cyanobacterium RL_1_1]
MIPSRTSALDLLATGNTTITRCLRRLGFVAFLGLIATTSPLISLRAAVAAAEPIVATKAETASNSPAIESDALIESQPEPDQDLEEVQFEDFDVIPFGQGLPRNLAESIASESPAQAENPIPSTPAVDPVPPVDPTPAPTFQRKVETRIQLDLSDRRLSLYADNELIGSYTVAVGKPGWETPIGDYSIMHMAIDPIWENPWTGELIYPGPTNPMGRAVIVFHTIGDDMIAFHGTPDEGLLGQAVSHGCVRMRNEDILAMYDIVRRGTPVSVVP